MKGIKGIALSKKSFLHPHCTHLESIWQKKSIDSLEKPLSILTGLRKVDNIRISWILHTSPLCYFSSENVKSTTEHLSCSQRKGIPGKAASSPS